MATIKIYGIRGMVERSLSIPCGRTRLVVGFTGGSSNAAASASAKYKTDNEVYQAIIENSDYFKRGYIRLLKTITHKGDAKKAAPQAGRKAGLTPVSAKEVAETAAEALPDEAEKAKVEVSDIEGEGRQYLIDHFGEKAGDLRSVKQIVTRAARHNVEFVLPGEKAE